MRLNLHTRLELAAAAILVLGSCSGPGLSDKQRDEVGDIAGDAVGDAIADSDKVREIEARLDAIEQRLDL